MRLRFTNYLFMAFALTISAYSQDISTASQKALSSNLTVTSSATFRLEPVARGSLVSIFGSGLSGSTSVDSVGITIKDSAGVEHQVSRVFSVSAEQINIQLPDSLSEGRAEITVIERQTGKAQTGSFTSARVSPGIFTANASGKGVPAATVLRVKADGTQSFQPAYRFDPATGGYPPSEIDLNDSTEQVFLVLFGTGWKNRLFAENATVYVDRYKVEAPYVGAQGNFPGLDQMNIRLPILIPKGVVEVLLIVDGEIANRVELLIK